MTRRGPILRPAALLLGLALLAFLPERACADALRLPPDSTTIESWRLGNGLRVVTQSIPGCHAAAITVAYPFGTDADPTDRPGLAQLVAEVQMMGPAGDVPERGRREMESLRPLGWSIKVGRRATQLSEVASHDQLPGALRQVATRMRGVTVTDAALRAAVAAVRRDQGEQLFGGVEKALYFQVREYAAGLDANAVLDRAAARALDGVAAKELEQRLRASFVPSGAVLALAGDFSGVNLHALIDHEFGGMPGGSPPAASDPRGPPFRASFRALARAEVDRPTGVLAVQAPALSDSLHPGFFLCMLVMGQHCLQSWGVSRLVPSRFRYSILDEPDLVRFYPPVASDSTDAHALASQLRRTLGLLLGMVVLQREYDEFRASVAWLLGGPMSPRILAQVRTEGAALNNVCNNLAARELTGGEAFWSRYRARFLSRGDPGLGHWSNWACLPEHQAGLLFTPLRK